MDTCEIPQAETSAILGKTDQGEQEQLEELSHGE